MITESPVLLGFSRALPLAPYQRITPCFGSLLTKLVANAGRFLAQGLPTSRTPR